MGMTTDEFLSHFGVKGMHWGVRNKKNEVVTHPRGHMVINHPSRADKKWQKNVYGIKGAIAVHNHVADQMNNVLLDQLNSNPKYKNHEMLDKWGSPNQDPISQSYFKEFERLNIEATQRALSAVHGTSPSGNFRAVLAKNDRGQWVTSIRKTDAAHADAPWEDLTLEVDLDDLGHVVQYSNVKDDSLAQSESQVDEFLSHFGVKGMHWGIRNDRKMVKPSSDKKKVEELRKKGSTALTNKQLKTVNDRLTLEQNFNRMNPTTRQKGEAQVKAALATFALGLSVFGLTHKEFLTKVSKAGQAFLKRRVAKKMVTTIVSPPSEMFIG